MGCNPLGKMMSRALAKVSKRRTPKPPQRVLVLSEEGMTKWVIPSKENPIYITQPATKATLTWGPHDPLPETIIYPSAHAYTPPEMTEEAKAVDEAPSPEFDTQNEIPASSSYDYRIDAYGFSPALAGNVRREYYTARDDHYCPTHVHEGFYDIATRGDHLTTMFSDENPNACNII